MTEPLNEPDELNDFQPGDYVYWFDSAGRVQYGEVLSHKRRLGRVKVKTDQRRLCYPLVRVLKKVIPPES